MVHGRVHNIIRVYLAENKLNLQKIYNVHNYVDNNIYIVTFPSCSR